jgi:acetyltransferase-like isoleucine patch superfamily enzyme
VVLDELRASVRALAGPRRRRFAAFGEGSRIVRPVVEIPNPTGIAIGRDVDIRAHAFLEAIAPRGTVVLTIGDGTYIGPFARISAITEVTIGRDVLIADRCYIADTGHVYEDVTVPIKHQPMRLGNRVSIGDGSWIGINVAIVGNVRIGEQSVVGANSVVREDVPPCSVVVGDPARVVRQHRDGRWQRVEAP